MERIKLKNILKELFLKEDKKWKNYTIPKDKKLLLYDFYVLSYLSTLNLQNIDVAKSGGSFVGRTSEELKRNILEVEKKLFPYLKKELLNTVFFAICSEIRHIFYRLEDPGREWDNIKNNKIYIMYRQLYQTKHGDIASEYEQKYSGIIPNKYAHSKRMASYDIIHELMKKLNLSEYDFVNFCKKMFSSLDWQESYGGKAWANICDGWTDLHDTSKNDLNKLQIQIDHIYDLQHNTGTVLNKSISYFKQSKEAKETGYRWIEKALNLKRDAKSMYELLKYCSSQMEKLAREAFKRAGVKRELLDIDISSYFNKIGGSNETLPDTLTHVGNLNASNYKNLKSLGKLKKVDGDLDISGTSIEKLPDTLTHVGGRLNAHGCKNLKDLGGLEKVGGVLDITKTSIEKLPDTLTHVGGLISFYGTNLKSLGKLKYVGDFLTIQFTSIEKLPNTLKYVGGQLHMEYCENLKDLGGLEKVGDTLYIRSTSIEKLPDTLTYIRKDLDVSNCKNLKDLGGLEKVGGWLDISHTSIEKLPDTLKYVGGNLNAVNCKNLTSLGGLEKVDGWLDVSGTSIEKLPDTLKHVGDAIYITNYNEKLIVPDHLKNKIIHA